MGSESRKNQTWPIFPSTSVPVPLRLSPELPTMLPRKPLKLNPVPPFSSDTTSIFSSDPATINTPILLPIMLQMLHPLLFTILPLMLPPILPLMQNLIQHSILPPILLPITCINIHSDFNTTSKHYLQY